jgi:5,10-methylenetetrahydromethanopterin reductase
MRAGIAIPHELQAHAILKFARLIDRERYHSIWKTEDYYFRDGISLLSAIAVHTKNIKIGTDVINPYTRNPALIAMTAATIDEVSSGRFILGIGSSTKVCVEEQMNIKLGRRITVLKETVEAIRKILSGDLVNFEGKEVKLKSVHLGFKPYRKNIPIYLAAVGPKMLQLAGEIADGVILTAASSPKYIRDFAIENIKIGAEKGGRKIEQIDICCNIIFSFSRRLERAKKLAKLMVGLCLSPPEYGKLIMKESGMEEELLIPIQQSFKEGDISSLWKYVTNDMVELFSVTGDETECRKKLFEYITAGVNTLILWPMSNYKQTIKKFKDFNQD